MSICDKIKEQIKITDYAAYLGFTVIKKGRYFSLKEHDSVIIDTRKNCYWQNSVPGTGNSIGDGGSVIDFAVKYGNMDVKEAIKALRNYGNITTVKSTRKVQKTLKQPKKEVDERSFIKELNSLKLSSDNMEKVFAYLIKTRKISPVIVRELRKEECSFRM